MKVKLTYSVELEKVKQKICEILDESSQSLESQVILMRQIVEMLPRDDVNETASLGLMDSIRRSLAEIDQSLVETSAILYGYNEAMKNPSSVMPNATQPPEAPPPVPEE